mgnify:CR=1 FL=1
MLSSSFGQEISSYMKRTGKLFSEKDNKLRSARLENGQISKKLCQGIVATNNTNSYIQCKESYNCKRYVSVLSSPRLNESLIDKYELKGVLSNWNVSFKLKAYDKNSYKFIFNNETDDIDDKITFKIFFKKGTMHFTMFRARSHSPAFSCEKE